MALEEAKSRPKKELLSKRYFRDNRLMSMNGHFSTKLLDGMMGDRVLSLEEETGCKATLVLTVAGIPPLPSNLSCRIHGTEFSGLEEPFA